MADTTIVNSPARTPADSGSAGWAVAVIILIAVIAAGYIWFRYYGTGQAAQQQPAPASNTTNIIVPAANPAVNAPAPANASGTTTP
jgi:hypothetical protein